MDRDSTLIALAKLDAIIRDPVSRQQFKADPYGTVAEAGIELENVPTQVWQVLVEMSFDELGAVAALGVALDESGLLSGDLAWHFVV